MLLLLLLLVAVVEGHVLQRVVLTAGHHVQAQGRVVEGVGKTADITVS